MNRILLNATATRWISSRFLVGFMAATLLAGGCAINDGAITVAEFMELQQQQQQAKLEAQKATASQAPQSHEIKPYAVTAGDTLTVTLSGLDIEVASPVQVLVRTDGTIRLPLVGSVVIAGMPLEEAEQAIHSAFVPQYVRDVAVNLQLVDFDTTQVLVTGAVQVPGLVYLRSDQRTLLHAVVQAGGVSDQTNGKATLQRMGRPGSSVTIDLTNPVELEAALNMEPLGDGDVVKVQAAFPNTIFVGGLVNGPAPQVYPPGVHINILQALAAAGGVRTDVTPKEGRLIRRMEDGQDIRVKIDLKGLQKGEEPNLLLAAGDILWVPETFETRFQDFWNRTLFFRAGVSVVYDPIQFENTQRALRQTANANGSNFSNSINQALRFGLNNAFFPIAEP